MIRIYKILPNLLQNVAISIYNFLAYRKRYGGNYSKFLKQFTENRSLTKIELEKIQLDKLNKFLNYAIANSSYYKNSLKITNEIVSIIDLNKFPISTKEDIRKNISSIYTIRKKEGIISKTGGTTGKTLEVVFTKKNLQEQFAMLDSFKMEHGYKLGKKTAWFSGKALLNEKDFNKNRFWKTDYLHKVRYYSTFHIKQENLKYYLENLFNFKPEFIVGFPSSILELAKYGTKMNIDFPKGIIKAIFPTAETITPESRIVIECFFKTKMYDQYASSEGAPFIFECKKGNLHLELQSGVFEVLDNNNNLTNKGRLVVTSFTTYGTPLIRYDIGDYIELKDGTCACGNNNPLAKGIYGRIDDFIYSQENGKINLGNITNTLKGVKGVLKFQVIQNNLDKLQINLVVDEILFTDISKNLFLSNWIDRVGKKMHLELNYVENIPNEKSGKYRLVKNNIKNKLKI